MFSKRWIMGMVMMLALMALAGCQAVSAQPAAPASPKVLEIEVAEDINRFTLTDDRVSEDGMPLYSTPFSTQGYIYPAGTLNGSNGVLADGSPEFPAEVLGEWTCFGWAMPDGEGGLEVVSTQIFNFDGAAGSGMITTQGFEIMEVGVPTVRTVNGTGDFAKVSSQTQTLMGMTDQMAVNLEIAFDLR